MSSLPEQCDQAHRLVATISRDIIRFEAQSDPNNKVAGDEALKNLNAAIRILSTVRHHLLVEMHGNDPVATTYGNRIPLGGRRVEPGNSGPGY